MLNQITKSEHDKIVVLMRERVALLETIAALTLRDCDRLLERALHGNKKAAALYLSWHAHMSPFSYFSQEHFPTWDRLFKMLGGLPASTIVLLMRHGVIPTDEETLEMYVQGSPTEETDISLADWLSLMRLDPDAPIVLSEDAPTLH